mmetsp:Transcript_128112/g.250928  ORF Transcript_128112/g.250928 Transcript_128112/m.250928 type:complete len:214 (+) Transcript_128112:582-1223(+)
MPCKPSSISILFALNASLSAARILFISAWENANCANACCKPATSSFSCADIAAILSICVVNLSISAVLSAFFSSDSASSFVQCACFVASASASCSNRSIMFWMRPFTFANWSWPLLAPESAAKRILEASCANAEDFCLLARSRTMRIASYFASDALFVIPELALTVCTKLYDKSDAPLTLSRITSWALATAAISSLRLFVSASKSSALLMQFW